MELKVILYVTLGIAYFIYKQFQRLQKQAKERQTQLFTNTSTNPENIELSKKLSEKQFEKLKSPARFTKRKINSINEESLNTKINGGSDNIYTSKADDENSEIEDYVSEKFGRSRANEIDFTQVRNLILYSELLKRPGY